MLLLSWQNSIFERDDDHDVEDEEKANAMTEFQEVGGWIAQFLLLCY